MADTKKRITELPESSSTTGLYTIGVNSANESVKVPLGDILEKYKADSTKVDKAVSDAATAKADASTAKTNAATALTTANTANDTANNAASAAVSAEESASAANQTANSALNTAEKAEEDASAAQSASTIAIQTAQSASSSVSARLFFNANKLLGKEGVKMSLEQVLALIGDDFLSVPGIYHHGCVLCFLDENGDVANYQYTGEDKVDFTSTEFWKKFGGSAAVGNCFNVTTEVPKSLGYYTLEEAVGVTYDKGYNNLGVQITFCIAENSWKTYQFVGSTTDETTFKNVDKWLDLAGMSAGDEAIINVDYLCGACTSAAFYTLEYAIAAIVALQTSTGITYAKSGLVITYKTSDTTFETKQFRGAASDFGEASLWSDFGGAGSKVETKDDPAKGGTDALSTGGAYTHIPADMSVDLSEENVLSLALVNADKEVIGETHQVQIKGGGGGTSGTIVTMYPESSPLYAKAAGSVILKAAIRSVTTQGTTETLNMIEKVEMYDRDTSQLLETFPLNQASSSDKETYDFSFDLSSYFTSASARKFKFVIYDDTDHNGSRNVNVTAVDVTIKSEQTLNYTASTIVNVGGSTKSLPMYRFANNASGSGIKCTTEIYINGSWKTLGEATIADTYSHSISINPQNCCGSVLTHGAYPIRIHGVDIDSGVVGNYLHTSIMVVNANSTTPIVCTRWLSDTQDGTKKQYETINVDFAIYNPSASSATAEVYEKISDGSTTTETMKQTTTALRSQTYTYTQRVKDVKTDGSVTILIDVRTGSYKSQTTDFKVVGSLIDIEPVTTQLLFDLDMEGRSNSDADKSIKSGDYELSVVGANYSSNGFVKDSYGTSEYGTESDTGEMSLRIAENVTGSLNYYPFNNASIETNGLAIQFRIRARHIADDSAKLISCIANGIGFYATGKKVVFTTDDEATTAHTITSALNEDTTTDVAIVIEPVSQAPYSGIGVAKMYFDGELIGTSYYESGSLTRHATPITFDGTEADLYLFNIRAWETYFTFEQDFNNYLLKIKDTDAMITEYEFNQVMSSQSAEGKAATNRPQAASLFAQGLPYFVLCKNADTEDRDDNYPEYLETLDGDKKTTRILDVYAYFPARPYQNFKAIGVTVSNQGTTSSKRPIKNIKMKLKTATITLLHTADEFTGEDLTKFETCKTNAEAHKVQVNDDSLPTNIITVKVDYSESGGANNGASTNLYNDLQRALGSDYRTPAQNAYTGSGTLNTSIDSIPCAFFRTDKYSSDATSPSYGYFHAKGNWNCDKGDAAFYGFEKCAGYNKKCLNYGDFYELVAAKDQTLADFLSKQDKTTWEYPIDEDDPSKGNFNVIVLSEFCGAAHRIFRRADNASEWSETTGTMTYSQGVWNVTGDVVNPVECYELLTYDALDWFQGISSVDDMLTEKSGAPQWLTYFESRYPDNDALNDLYEAGKKVPYQLYRWLKFCQDCNHHLTASDGNITLDGSSVSGTPANRLLKWKHELHKYANVHSAFCYHIFTDYLAAVDQRSKNMMIGFYLDTDGVERMYLNHLYDGDTILGSDNDCGLTIDAELDPNNDTEQKYQGYDSVFFVQNAKTGSDGVWLDDDGDATLTLAQVAAAMRSQNLSSGLNAFSPDGLEKYWITDRLSKWPKLVSSYDGVRKYIEHSTAAANYFFALHGLSTQRLQDFIKTRFLFRDGYYQTGDLFSSAIAMRCTGTNMSVTIKAAKKGYFGIGVDRASTAYESVYLDAGETATLHTDRSSTGGGYMLYIFGANKIEELDISNATPKQQGWDISELTLLKKFIIGGADYTPATTTGEELATLALGQLPFLEELDVRNFPLTSIDATYCPRLKQVLATGSTLQTITLAETSPISELTLPATMTNLNFVNLPNLSYPNGSLTIAGLANVKRLKLSGCANIDTKTLLENIVSEAAVLNEIMITGLNLKASVSILEYLKECGTKGIGSDLSYGCDGLVGKYSLEEKVTDSKLAILQAYFTETTIINSTESQFTMISFDDTMSDPQNVTNCENNTTGDDYVPTGHLLKIRQGLIPVFGQYSVTKKKWIGKRLSENNYRKLFDETDFDYTDQSGTGNDAMMRFPACWYKGINDFKNQKKYMCWSALSYEPLSTADNITRKKLSEIMYKQNYAVFVANITEGESTLDSEGVVSSQANYSVYAIDVAGMKQVRFPAINNASIGVCFVNSDGLIIKKWNLAVSNSLFDFVEGEYCFIDVPTGAKKLYFSARTEFADYEAIAVDSSEIEAIEPDWVHNDAWLGGIYEASVDGLTQLRSISGSFVKVGTGTQTTSSEWTYDDNGRPTNTPLNTMNYTQKDFSNLAYRRGTGYQLFDYEMSKLTALLWYAINGHRNSQLKCGNGRSAGGSNGYTDTIGNNDSYYGQVSGNKILGFESFVACTYEWMDNAAVNVVSYAQFLKNKSVGNSSDPVDAKWHIYDPVEKTERVVQGITTSGYCVARLKFGRFCDIIASKMSSDNSTFATYYTDGQYYSASTGRVVGRANYSSYAGGGLVCTSSNIASSRSSSFSGSRLAFRGSIEIEDE